MKFISRSPSRRTGRRPRCRRRGQCGDEAAPVARRHGQPVRHHAALVGGSLPQQARAAARRALLTGKTHLRLLCLAAARADCLTGPSGPDPPCGGVRRRRTGHRGAVHGHRNGAFNVTDTTGLELLTVPGGQAVSVAWTGSGYTIKQGTQALNSPLPSASSRRRHCPRSPGPPNLCAAISRRRSRPTTPPSSGAACGLWSQSRHRGLRQRHRRGIGGVAHRGYKALAVAYRTYALVTQQKHRADSTWGEPFDLGSSTDWVAPYTGANQIYSACIARPSARSSRRASKPPPARLSPTTASPARHAVLLALRWPHPQWAEVWHGNDHPWLYQRGLIPDSNGEQLLGHGVGMPLRAPSNAPRLVGPTTKIRATSTPACASPRFGRLRTSISRANA